MIEGYVVGVLIVLRLEGGLGDGNRTEQGREEIGFQASILTGQEEEGGEGVLRGLGVEEGGQRGDSSAAGGGGDEGAAGWVLGDGERSG